VGYVPTLEFIVEIYDFWFFLDADQGTEQDDKSRDSQNFVEQDHKDIQ
jgi:hypothetical protein